RRAAAVEDAVAVVAFHGREARVEIGRDRFGPQHRDGVRLQVEVERVPHRLDRPLPREVDMRDLAEGMDAGIGTTGAVERDGLAGEGGGRRLQRALHGRLAVLPLPAGERRAVIFQRQLVARHQPNRVPTATGTPRKKSATFIAWRPARCTSRSRTAPVPQATVSASSRTVPGTPVPSASVERRTFTRSGALPKPASNQAPCSGDSPRMWLWTSPAGCDQSIRVSPFSIFLA